MYAMLIDRHLTTEGEECDKIGVSYEGFASQSDACHKNFNSCLGNQIEDRYQVGPPCGAGERRVLSPPLAGRSGERTGRRNWHVLPEVLPGRRTVRVHEYGGRDDASFRDPTVPEKRSVSRNGSRCCPLHCQHVRGVVGMWIIECASRCY